MRRMAAARFADGCVRELSRRPPEILFLGARVSQDVKCFSVGQRLISVPIIDLRQVHTARELMQGRTHVESRFIGAYADLAGYPGSRQRSGRRVHGGGQSVHMCVQGAVTGGELRVTRIEEGKILLQDEEMLGPIVPGQGGDDLGFGGMAPRIPMRGELGRITVTGDDVSEDP